MSCSPLTTQSHSYSAPAALCLVALLLACVALADDLPEPQPPFAPELSTQPPPPFDQEPAPDEASDQTEDAQADDHAKATDADGKRTEGGPAAPSPAARGEDSRPLFPLGDKPPAASAQDKRAQPPESKRQSGISGFLRDIGLFQGVTVTGQNTFTFQEHSIEGSQRSFQSQRWDTGNLVRQSSLQLQGPVWKDFVFQAGISDSGWGPSYTRWIAGYMTDDTALLYGDLDLSIGGHEFIGFRKSTRGWQLDQRLPGNGLVRGFYTREKGVTRNQTFVGNDTPGPYFLTFTPVIEGSETVKVNERHMRFGTDYRLDYDSGQLWFEPVDGQPRIITAADTISVSYQSLGYLSQGPSEIYGARAEMPLLDDCLLVGVTFLQQDRHGEGQLHDTVGYQEDVYHGSGTTGPFDTNFRPIIPDGTSAVYKGERRIIDRPLVVLVDGTEQIEGADYDAYRSIGRIIFRRAVPPTALVIIRYYYDIAGDRPSADHSTWGIDMAYRIAPGMNFALDWAASSGGTSGADGDALSTSFGYSRDGVNLMAEYRAIDPGFSFMDAVGFRRRERGFNLGGEWRVNDYVSVSNRFSSMDSDSGLSFGYSGYGGGSGFHTGMDTYPMTAQATPGTGLTVGTRRNDLGIRVNRPGWPDFSYQRGDMSNTGGTTGASSYATDSLQLSYAPRGASYSVRSSYNRTKQESRTVSSSADGATALRGSKSDQFQTAVTYNPLDTLSVAASLATNASSAIEAVNRSSARNVQLSARWNPSAELSVDFSHSESKTDGRVSSGYYSTYTDYPSTPGTGTTLPPHSGYLPPGGGGGVPPSPEDPSQTARPRSDDASDRLSVNWRPTNRLSLDLSLARRKYESTGAQGYLADSTQNTWNLGAMWQLSDALALNLSFGADNLQFLDADRGGVRNRSYILSAGYRPPGARWNTGLTLNIQDGSSPTYVGHGRLQRYLTVPTKLFDLNGQFTYRISDDLSLQASAGLSDFAGGYADFRKNTGDLRLRYQVSSSTGLDLGYRFIRNISRGNDDGLVFGTTGAGQNYIANTFMLALNTNFRGGIGSSDRRLSGGGFSGGPGTFGGYRTGLPTTGHGVGMGPDTYRTGRTGFGIGTGASHGTGYGPSAFDTLGSYDLQERRHTDLFGPGSPFGHDEGRYAPPPTRPGGISEGLGEFRKRDRPAEELEPGLDLARPPSEDTRPPAAPEADDLEDWWLLWDNIGNW